MAVKPQIRTYNRPKSEVYQAALQTVASLGCTVDFVAENQTISVVTRKRLFKPKSDQPMRITLIGDGTQTQVSILTGIQNWRTTAIADLIARKKTTEEVFAGIEMALSSGVS